MTGWIIVLAMALAIILAVAQYAVLKHYQLVSKRVEGAAIAVETVTRTILEHQTIASEKRLAHEEGADLSAEDVKDKLDVIHTLVNSDMTEARTETRNLLSELLKRTTDPTEAAALESRLTEVDAILAERAEQQKKVDDANA
jgi:hypothetical protein